MKIITILGARPQFIKSSALSDVFNSKYKKKIKEIIVHTGQHYDFEMSKIFFKEFKLNKPKYFLNISKLNHLEMTGKMIFKLDKIIIKEKPDLILIYGDTNSTLAGAIASAKKKIPIAHIEAGLRSKNNQMQEEINRIVTDRLSNLLYCPTDAAKKNLLNENFHKFQDKKLYDFGDVMFDIHKKKSLYLYKKNDLNDYFLVTIHREENCKKEIILNILDNLKKLSKIKKIVFPAHPRLTKIIKNTLNSNRIFITKPLNYLNFGRYIHNSFAVITDSGGVQKESFFFKKNCFVIREQTEWKELIEKKYNVLINPKKKLFYKDILNTKFNKINVSFQPYGDGKSSEKIANSIYNFLLKKQ